MNDVTYAYTALDQTREISESGLAGRVVDFQYDARGLLSQAVRKTHLTLVETDKLKYAYEPSGRLKSVTPPLMFGIGAGNPVTYTYNANGRLQTVNDGSHTATYSWELGGERVTSVEDANVREERCYDGVGRLSSIVPVFTGSGQSLCGLPPPQSAFTALQYQYDARGNRTLETRAQRILNLDVVTNDESRFGYDAANRLMA